MDDSIVYRKTRRGTTARIYEKIKSSSANRNRQAARPIRRSAEIQLCANIMNWAAQSWFSALRPQPLTHC